MQRKISWPQNVELEVKVVSDVTRCVTATVTTQNGEKYSAWVLTGTNEDAIQSSGEIARFCAYEKLFADSK